MERDVKYLERAIDLAELGRGRTYPNPMVGAVIVNKDRIVGEGYHEKSGEPHAEINALAEAGSLARGGVLYVTLEPCCHVGKTGPCTDRVIEAGIRQVIVGMVDPNPKVNGEGIRRLKAAGIAVTVLEIAKAVKQNELYLKYIKTGQPFVLLKIAISMDGRIAAPIGKRTALTQPIAQHEVHVLRSEYPAIMTGIGTVLIDDPKLNCRLEGTDVKQPVRIIVDSQGRLPLKSRVAKTAMSSPVVLATTDKISLERERELTAVGVDVMVCESNGEGRVDLADLLKRLAARQIAGVLVEGGAALNRAMVSERLVDKLALFVAPKVIGSGDSLGMVGNDADVGRDFIFSGCRLVGEDLMVEAYPSGAESV